MIGGSHTSLLSTCMLTKMYPIGSKQHVIKEVNIKQNKSECLRTRTYKCSVAFRKQTRQQDKTLMKQIFGSHLYRVVFII